MVGNEQESNKKMSSENDEGGGSASVFNEAKFLPQSFAIDGSISVHYSAPDGIEPAIFAIQTLRCIVTKQYFKQYFSRQRVDSWELRDRFHVLCFRSFTVGMYVHFPSIGTYADMNISIYFE